MDKEKILYHAKHNGGFNIRSCEYHGKIMENLDYLIKNKFIRWMTNELWDDYSGSGQQDLYENAIHDYQITNDGEVLLAIYRMAYTHKNHLYEEKHLRRIEEFWQLIEVCGKSDTYFEKFLTKNQNKALAYARQVHCLPVVTDEDLTDPDLSQHSSIPNQLDEIDLDEPVLTSMFNMSTGLGPKDSDPYRTENYVLRKTNEELGEMTLEMNIADGLSYKEAGKDGVKGEAVDLAICAMDMFALQCPGMSAEEIEREFLTYMLVKLNKWRDTLK